MPPIYINGQEVVKRYVGIQEVVAAYVGSHQVFSSGVPLSKIQAIFANGEKGAIWDYGAIANNYQDTAGTTPVTASGQVSARVNDLSGNNNHLLQSTSGRRTMFGQAAVFDGVDDGFVAANMNWGSSTHITSVVSLREGYKTYAYGMVDAFSTAAGGGFYVGTSNQEVYEVACKNPTSKFGPLDKTNRKVLDYSLDTSVIPQDEAIVLHVNGVAFTPTYHVAGRNYSETLSPVTMKVGLFNNDTYPTVGERYRQVVINRPLTAQEMADVRAWCQQAYPVYATGLNAQLNMFQITGQSLAEGGNGAPVTTAQEYDNVMFTLLENNPAAYVPAVNVTTNLESPMYGQIGHLKALIAAQEGASNYQMLGCNNGVGSASILILDKGGATFDIAMSQVTAAKSIADGQGRSFRFRAVSYVQGETDNAMSRTDYKSAIMKLATNYSHSGKLSAKQAEDVVFITSQVCSNTLPNVALAQLDAAIEHPLIYLSTPLYPLNFDVDGRHLLAPSAKVLGGYMAIVYKRVVVDGGQWEPLRPISHVQDGNDVTITFNVPSGPLVLDTTLIQAQTNYGFSAADSGGTPIAVTGVVLVGTDKVKITTASPVPSGGYINYAQTTQTEPVRSLGGCGNLRDSQGDTITYTGWPMHNWCVLFTQVIA